MSSLFHIVEAIYRVYNTSYENCEDTDQGYTKDDHAKCSRHYRPRDPSDRPEIHPSFPNHHHRHQSILVQRLRDDALIVCILCLVSNSHNPAAESIDSRLPRQPILMIRPPSR